MPEAPPKPKVIYIASAARSGSTLLDTLLGQLDGFFSAGELSHIWDDALLKGRLCGCGRRVTDCEIWKAILEQSLGEPMIADPLEMLRLQQETVRLRHLPGLLRMDPPPHPGKSRLVHYAQTVSRLLLSIPPITGARVIIDSSKRPGDAALIRLLPGIDAFLIHLVRDPRGVAASMQKHQNLQPESIEDPAPMPTASSTTSARLWLKWNTAIEPVRHRYGPRRSLVVRYEDVAADPEAVVRSIAQLVGEPADGLVFKNHETIAFAGNHTVWGNAIRFKQGDMTIRRDDAWVKTLSRRDRMIVTAITLPLLLRYRYPVGLPERPQPSAL